MSVKDILTHIRASFLAPPPPALDDLRPLIDVYISDAGTASDPAKSTELDDGLLDIYSDAVDHSDVSHIGAFVGVLYALRMVLSSAAIISWFDSLLRRALREPRLAPDAVVQAKELVLMPLYDDKEAKAQLLRRRLVQLYVLDAPKENDNAVEQMTQEADERAKMAVWKNNLEDLLVSDGFTRPKELFEELDVSFRSSPESRLQLCILLNRLSRSPRKIVVPFANSPFFSSLLFSLQADQSTTVFSIGVTALIMLLPALAVDTPALLNACLPSLVTILARVICWKLREPASNPQQAESPQTTMAIRPKGWSIREDLNWKQLDNSFESAAAPNETRLYFTFMYGLYPCNTIAFLKSPVEFLRSHEYRSIFTADWNVMLDEEELKSCSRPLLRGHVVHPSLILADSACELEDLNRWAGKDVATVAAECTLLDIQNAQKGITGHSIAYYVPPTPQASGYNTLHPPSVNPAKIPLPPSPSQPPDPDVTLSRRSSGDQSSKSLEIMINTHATLTAPVEPPTQPLLTLDEPRDSSAHDTPTRPRYIMAEEALSILQRDVLILKNQLNFEIYLKELVQQHVGRLHLDRIVSRSEEAERQGLHTKLKDYKTKLAKAQEDLATIRAEAAGTKQRHNQWVTELQDKLSRFREEKKSWATEAVELRSEVNEARATLKAQSEVLADAQNEVFNLKQQLRETAPKVEKIAAYEHRIDQLVRAQALRDDSPEMRAYREDRAKLDEMISNYAKMELKLESLQHANEQLTALHKTQEDQLNLAKSQVTDLTRRLASATAQNPFNRSATKAAALAQDRINKLEQENAELSNKNMVLMDEVDEVKAMVEFLRSERVNYGGAQSPVQRMHDPSGHGPSPRLNPTALADLADATSNVESPLDVASPLRDKFICLTPTSTPQNDWVSKSAHTPLEDLGLAANTGFNRHRPFPAAFPPINIAINVDEGFLKSCFGMSKTTADLVSSSPPEGSLASPPTLLDSPTDTLASPTAGVGSKADPVTEDDWSRLTRFYPNAITDFYGSGTPCVFKKGPEWPAASGPNSQKIVRAARPIYSHPIQPTWLKTAWAIVDSLDSLQVNWNAVDPLAYANAGEAALICEFVITIAVLPGSLAYDAAVTAADAVTKILVDAGFPDIEVAFIESVYRSQGTGPKLMSFDPTLDLEGLPALRKPFTPTLGLSIAPLKSPYYEGSGGLFLRLSSDEADKRVGLLTCAHVSHPPPLFQNKAYTRKNDSQPREDVLLLGTEAFNNAVSNIMKFIGNQVTAISSWELALSRVPAWEESEAKKITARRDELVGLINAAKTKIEEANELHSYVTKNFTTTEARVFGFVLHNAKIEVDTVDGFMYDWSIVQLDNDKIKWDEFKGNKLFVGGNKTDVDWTNYMFPQVNDRPGFHTPEDMLLALKGYVPEDELRSPQNLDIHNVKTLLAVKNGRTTGTTFGRVNGLESITRKYPEHGISQKALEFIVCGYDTVTGDNAKFSDNGDSGSFVVGRDGRLIGQLTGGGGPTDRTDKSYITPYFALKKAVDKQFPGCHLLDS